MERLPKWEDFPDEDLTGTAPYFYSVVMFTYLYYCTVLYVRSFAAAWKLGGLTMHEDIRTIFMQRNRGFTRLDET
jgi:hypothetical protein